ncbi:MAG: FtsX-like permease family protein [Pseudomonadota bacterium]
MNTFKLAWYMLLRDVRAGEMLLLAAALIVAVASVTSVGFFTDRTRLALTLQASQLLGADLVVAADHEVPPAYIEQAQRMGLETAHSAKFPSMVLSNGANLLAEVKAASNEYPLRGELRIADSLSGQDHAARAMPQRGTLWADERLLRRLNLDVGQTLSVGNMQFTIAAVLTQEPDSSTGFINLGPRVLLNESDLSATGLVQPGSRIGYRLLLAGEAAVVAQYRAWVQSRLARGERIEGVRDARPEIRRALERTESYLGLAAVLAAVLAGVAVLFATRRYLQRHLDSCALMRCLGAEHRQVMGLYLSQFLLLGALASALGCVLGYAAQQALTYWLGQWVGADLPPPSMQPALQGFATGLVLLLGFALPPLLALAQVPALRVLRRELGVPHAGSGVAYAVGIALLAALIVWQAGDATLGVYVVTGLAAALLLFGVSAWGVLRMVARGNGTWRFGVANLRRRLFGSVAQIVALALGIMALLTLALVRGDLLATWQTSLPPDAPNVFLINIQPEQVPELRRFFVGQGVVAPEFHAMVRGRLTRINQRSVSAQDYADERAQRLIEREFNLSWAAELQADNRITAGQWWSQAEHGQALLSVETGIAETLGIRLGDTLGYEVAGQTFEAKVASLRKVEWDSFHANFFVLAPPGLLETYPATFITSFHLPAAQAATLNRLVQAYPNVLAIDVAAVMAQVQAMMDQAARAVEFVFLFSLAAGVLVLYAAFAATQQERQYDAAVMRVLGATRRQLMRMQLAEFALLGALSGLLAAFGASVLGWVLARQVLHLPYHFSPMLWWAGIVCGTLGAALAGMTALRALTRVPPLQTLRKLG